MLLLLPGVIIYLAAVIAAHPAKRDDGDPTYGGVYGNATTPAASGSTVTSPDPSQLPFLAVVQYTDANTNGTLSACNTTYADTDSAVVITRALYGDPQMVSPLCGQHIWLNNAQGTSLRAEVMDVCDGSGCGDEHSLVLTKALYTQLGGDLDVGLCAVLWGWAAPSN